MEAKDAIALLSKLDPNEPLIIAWWARNSFNLKDPEDWGWVAENVTCDFDWSRTNDDIQRYIDND